MLHIRLAEREDVDALFALDQACFRPEIAYSKVELKYFMFNPASISLVAEDDGRIAGFAIAELKPDKGHRIGHVVTIDVVSEQRRRGVGRVLMDALLDACRRARAELMRLEVAVDNDGAIAFYKLLGFEETGRIRGFYMGRLDALRMELAVQADVPSHSRT